MSASDLRARLHALRSDALRRLGDGDGIDAGLLGLVGNVSVALDALDALDRVPDDAEPMARAVVVDIPGEPIMLSLFTDDGSASAVELSPTRAIAVAGQLLDAALRRLPR